MSCDTVHTSEDVSSWNGIRVDKNIRKEINVLRHTTDKKLGIKRRQEECHKKGKP